MYSWVIYEKHMDHMWVLLMDHLCTIFGEHKGQDMDHLLIIYGYMENTVCNIWITSWISRTMLQDL